MSRDPEELKLEIVELVAPEEGQPGSLALAICSADLEWRRKYEAHIRSAKWRNIRRDLFRLRGRNCEECGMSPLNLDVHHVSYERLGAECPSDLKILCKACHDKADRDREARVTDARQGRRIGAAFATWFEKRMGSGRDWLGYATPYDYEEFQEWIKSKERDDY